jgi:hypothetical protein
MFSSGTEIMGMLEIRLRRYECHDEYAILMDDEGTNS